MMNTETITGYLRYGMEGLLAAVTLALLHPDGLRRRLSFHAEEVHQKAIHLLQAVGTPDEGGVSGRLKRISNRSLNLTRSERIPRKEITDLLKDISSGVLF